MHNERSDWTGLGVVAMVSKMKKDCCSVASLACFKYVCRCAFY